ncbi:hypothetical protein DDB_G0286915 [Dictyostelium discoideum AX4]|uniref:Putative uncharacterized protein DDB_G0286915 n=1 Tax=Dictyostelium discoideum TaxID=44689 RepID=Y7187_DICDI|nr:hypothetical protein DDB_G0286915 [Dictyostelium discoideum AX4]Q54L43.1 RecName: Full=Putative uncharacterized protein DDB_G0286915 [Dictyostelium discoideum]EAL63955.1 hypothetical protein DDB_G0286915 [Dictyostelium discoideum AX4]|eukprot:XP_637460.1 hypothetical protein DDB_G0286915 [Dictyostelium discoideum AX4]
MTIVYCLTKLSNPSSSLRSSSDVSGNQGVEIDFDSNSISWKKWYSGGGGSGGKWDGGGSGGKWNGGGGSGGGSWKKWN